MTLNDSSSLILIVGAIAILAFVVHGLWFSGRSINRKLSKSSKEDQEIVLSGAVGKVRIVRAQESDSFNDNQSVSVETYSSKAEIKPRAPSPKAAAKNAQPENTYELNVVANPDKPYRGLDLEELCREVGFIRTDKNIYCVYENPVQRDHVVFRICSLESPYTFPVDMKDFSTRAIAIYMKLPQKGKASLYFKAMRIAAGCLIDRLGGTILDNNNNPVSEEELDAVEKMLKRYDSQEG